jgi:hypothetical protein
MKINEVARMLADELASQREKQTEKPPRGFFTVREIASQSGRSRPRVGEIVRTMVSQGKLEVRNFRIKTGARIYPVPHYRKA